MKETYSKLNSTQRIVVNFLHQLVTECTDRVPVTQPCIVASITDYSVPTGYTGYRLHSLVQLFQQLVTECSDWIPATQPSLNGLLHISRLQNLPAYYQPAPRITTPRSSTSWPFLISSLFTGLRLMTGLIMCSP